MEKGKDDRKNGPFDYVIVGAGSAGCVLANRLTEDKSTTVLVVEAGPSDRHPFVAIPSAFPRLFNSRRDWGYHTAPQENVSSRSLYFPRGRMLGGSSSLNAMMWIPGFSADYDSWAQAAGEGWSYDSLRSSFIRATGAASSSGSPRCSTPDAPLTVSPQRDPSALTRAWAKAAAACGVFGDGHDERDEEELFALVNQSNGRRRSAADAYLKEVRRSNLVIWTKASATRILSSGGKAQGVQVVRGRHVAQVEARAEVIVAAGAIGSPQLLACSGIGPPRDLQDLGIDVVARSPEVGKNLQDHLTAGIAFASSSRATLRGVPSIGSMARYLVARRGLLTSNVAEGYGYARSHTQLQLPDLEMLFVPGLFIDEGLTLPTRSGLTLAAVLLTPQSTGEVRIVSPDARIAPVIDPCYLSDEDGHDERVLRFGLRLCLKIAATDPLAPTVGTPFQPSGLVGEQLVDASLHQYAQTLYHPVGTCRMGCDLDAVVDESLLVRGVEGLRVVDASAIPRITRGHTHAATIALAERAAELISAARRSRR